MMIKSPPMLLLSIASQLPGKYIITGDFNAHNLSNRGNIVQNLLSDPEEHKLCE